MNRKLLLATLPLLALAACDTGPKGSTTTKLDAVEVQPGTISDSMIILDDAAADGTAIDTSVPASGAAKTAAKQEEADDDAPGEDGGEGEALSAPVAKKADTPAPAKKAGE
ncbi:MAG TPA: hypothetical protein PKD48_10810 [Sphingopyxis sp.]|nr:hypothetical protein [Sphingopyxis sp.]HMQ19234.1 hypothetical protein [Sphingopyxis sp.]